MATSLQLFPQKTWRTARFSIMSGNHVRLNMTDNEGTKYELTLFVHGSTDKETNALALLLKEAAAELEIVCDKCGHVVEGGGE